MIQKRIAEYLDFKGVTPYRFCKDLSIALGFLNKKGAIGTDKYLKIINQYPDINPEWLLTGKGDMIKNNTGNIATGNGIIQHSPNAKINQILDKEETIIAQQKQELLALKKRIKELEEDKKNLYKILHKK